MAYCKNALVRTHASTVGGVDGKPRGQSAYHWDYATDDAPAVVEAAAYFAAAFADGLTKGDKIDAVMSVAGTPVRKAYVVTAISDASVTLAVQSTALG